MVKNILTRKRGVERTDKAVEIGAWAESGGLGKKTFGFQAERVELGK